VALRYVVRINGVNSIAVTKLDVLDGLEELKVCHAYELDGETITEVPLDLARLNDVKPVYTSLPGWSEDTTGITAYADLPPNAKVYLNHIATDLKVDICVVSTGAKRKETILV
jgi:adenylosuccinate synthase